MEPPSPNPAVTVTALKRGSSHLFFRRAGRGDPLLLIHGLLVSGAMFDPVLPALTRHHQTIVPDLRGYGRSQRLPGPYTVPQLAADLATLLDTLSLKTVDVLGYSQGGPVAQQLAHDYPGRVRRLVLACTYAHNLSTFQEKIEAAGMPWLLRMLGPRGFMRFGLRASEIGRTLSPRQARWLENLAAINDTPHMIAAAKAMRDFDSRRWLRSIRNSTLIVAGGADKAVPLHHARMLAHGICGARLQIVEGAGHLLIVTHTEQFLSLVEEFLRTSDSH
jgi:pimeloyl-ACP methyl ester carboxylesterase